MRVKFPRTSDPVVTRSSRACLECGTELAAGMLSCPACGALVHSTKLKEIAAAAETHASRGDTPAARAEWERALRLLPVGSQQHSAVETHVRELAARADAVPARKVDPNAPAWRRALGPIATAALVLLGKLKFLLLGLTKLGTLMSMLAFFGLYWAAFGWPLAAGLVVSIYIHEMGHVAELRRLGIDAGAPFFIPGIGALIRLRQRIDDPVADARIGLAGPIWGLGAALAAYAMYVGTRNEAWAAIAQLGGYINLFNLIPVWQLDGSRGFHALSRAQRWAVVGVIAATYAVTEQGLLLIIGAVAIYRASQRTTVRSDLATLVKFGGLIVALAALAAIPLQLHAR